MNKFAVFDIDGTIYRWQLYHEMFDELYLRKIIPEEEFDYVAKARKDWQKRLTNFESYEIKLIKVMEKCIVGVDESVFIDIAKSIVELRGQHTYRYTTNLINKLKESGYKILAISGSPNQAVEIFAKLHKIDIAYGVKRQVVDGKFTANTETVYDRKAEILTNLVQEHNLIWDDSYAIGDTMSDSYMLKLVTNPIAFNPDRKLYDRARQEGWKIVVERKDIIYELESSGNTFVLA